MKNAILVLSALQMGACATSTTPLDGIDGGPRLDAATFDVPSRDSFSNPDAAVRDAGPLGPDAGLVPDTGALDAGPRDSGPVRFDAGRRDTGPLDGGPAMCMPEGIYAATPRPTNPDICASAGLTSCIVTSGATPAFVNLDCAGVTLECALTAGCRCTGSTVFAGIPIDARIDFDMGTATFMAAGMECDFRITLR